MCVCVHVCRECLHVCRECLHGMVLQRRLCRHLINISCILECDGSSIMIIQRVSATQRSKLNVLFIAVCGQWSSLGLGHLDPPLKGLLFRAAPDVVRNATERKPPSSLDVCCLANIF